MEKGTQANAYVQSKSNKEGKRLEFFILIISVPLFLIIVLLLSVFVLAKYPYGEPAKDAPPVGKSTETNEGADNAIA